MNKKNSKSSLFPFNTQNPIGIIGLGLIGSVLAKIFLQNGFKVLGYDIDPLRCEILQKQGVQIIISPAEMVSSTKCIFFALMTSKIVQDVIFGKNGIIEGHSAFHSEVLHLIDTTTGDPLTMEKIAQDLAKDNISYLECMIAGSSHQLLNYDATLLIGGNLLIFQQLYSLFKIISSQSVYIGENGKAIRAKLVINLVLGLNRAVLAEGLVFSEKIGLDLAKMLELFRITPAYSKMVDLKGEKMIHAEFTPQAKLSQHAKDVQLIIDLAHSVNQELPFSKIHLDLLKSGIEANEGDLDNSAIIKEIRRRTFQ
jgi:3-hydroxyisobutyrate dehydrogenase-like beta-hydroxyacid dehydrogenase